MLVTSFFSKIFSDRAVVYGCAVEEKRIDIYLVFWGNKSALNKEQIFCKLNYEQCLAHRNTIELSTASNMLMSMANVMYLSMVSFDAELIRGAATSMRVVKSAVHSVITATYPFFNWKHKLITFTIVSIIIATVIIVGITIYICTQNKNGYHQLFNIR
jgi:hypothetical protein